MNRKEKRRFDKVCEVIDSAFKADSRVAVIRVDLGYKEGKSSAQTINKDLDKLYQNARSKPNIFKDKIVQIIKVEKSGNDGYHAHALFAFKGHNVKNHKAKAEQIGKYWQNEITKGNGNYHNCNSKEYPKYSLGVIERDDEEAKNALKENVLGYICKDEQSTRSDGSDKNIREFRCSVSKKIK